MGRHVEYFVEKPVGALKSEVIKLSLGCQLTFWLARQCVELENSSIWSFNSARVQGSSLTCINLPMKFS